MGDSIQAGDVVSVGGAACVAPTKCDECGAPAVQFTPVRHSDPWRSRVEARCADCAERERVEQQWYGSLSRPDKDLWAIDRHDVAEAEARGELRYAAELRAKLADLFRRTGAPASIVSQI